MIFIVSCSNNITNEQDNIDTDNIKTDIINEQKNIIQNTFREISYDEIQKYNFVWYKIDYDNLLYKDINNDWVKEAILISQDSEAEEWVSWSYTKMSDIKNLKVLLLWYDWEKDSWSLLSNIDLDWTLYLWMEFYDINKITYLFVSYRWYWESDWHEDLSILAFENWNLVIKEKFSTSITNWWDIIIKENWNTIYEIDKIHWEWEPRTWCHKFIVHEYKYENWEYNLTKSKTTNIKYITSDRYISGSELEDYYYEWCHNVWWSFYRVHDDKIKAILENVGL